jgi:hypothetical protein
MHGASAEYLTAKETGWLSGSQTAMNAFCLRWIFTSDGTSPSLIRRPFLRSSYARRHSSPMPEVDLFEH